MKKILSTVIAMMLVIVMCFTFVACSNNDNGNGDKGQKNELTVGGMHAAASALLNSDGFTGTVSYATSSDKSEAKPTSYSVDKRGSKVKITDGDDGSVIYDYKTGYKYHGGNLTQSLTAGQVEYYDYLIGKLIKTYDVKDKKLELADGVYTYKVDFADDVNKYLEPLYSAYKNNKSIKSLISSYCEMHGLDFNGMYSTVITSLKNPAMTVGTMMDMLKANNMDIEAVLKEAGIVTEQTLPVIRARSLGKAVVGAYNYVMELVGDMIGGTLEAAEVADYPEQGDNDSDGNIADIIGDMDIEGMLEGLVEAAFFTEIDDAEVENTVDKIEALLTVALNITVKTTIDGIFESNPTNPVYVIIKNGVTLTKLSAEFSVKLDEQKRLSSLNVNATVAHSLTGAAAENTPFADNNYKFNATVNVDSYATSDDFEIEYGDRATYEHPLSAVTYKTDGKDVSVYLDNAGKTVKVAKIDVRVYDSEDADPVDVDNTDNAKVKFDAATSSFVFDGAFVKSTFKDAAAGKKISAIVYYGDEGEAAGIGYYVELTYMNDDVKQLAKLFVSDMMNGIF